MDIPTLSRQRLLELLDYNPETGFFTWKVNKSRSAKKGQRAGTVRSDGYRSIEIDGKKYMAHRLSLFYMNRPTENPICIECDHINGIRSDNRALNLRAVTHEMNLKNSAKSLRNTSGCVGVSWRRHTATWHAYIGNGGSVIYLGDFGNLLDAAAARKSAEVMHGFHPNHGRSL